MGQIDLPDSYDGDMAWRAADLAPDAGVIKLNSDALAELDAAAATLRSNPLPV